LSKGSVIILNVCDYIINALSEYEVKHIFGYIGAKNIALIEAVYRNEKVKFVNVYHEQTASFAACAYAQINRKLGVAVSTSGPGGTNMLTGIAQAYCDSIPVLFITGQNSLNVLRNGRKIRNESNQEIDIVAVAEPITKYAVQIHDVRDLPYELAKSVYLATSGRPGPVLLDIPENIQWSEFEPDGCAIYQPESKPEVFSADRIKAGLKALCANCERPVIVVGNGAHGFESEIMSVTACNNVPVAASMSAIDIYDGNKPNYLGVTGNYGLRCANFALANADLIIALGCSMSKRYTGNDLSRFAANAKAVRVDIDEEELAARTIKPDELKICSDLQVFFDNFGDILREIKPNAEWLRRVHEWKERYYFENVGTDKLQYEVLRAMNRLRRNTDVVTADVGNNQLWVIQTLIFKAEQKFVSTSGLSTMGYGLPAAIGAYYANPNADIICICGDGGLQMCIQELQFPVREKIPITIVLFNNGILGTIRSLQDTYYGGKHYASEIDYSAPDFVSVAKAYGIRAEQVNSVEQFERVFALRGDSPLLIDVRISPNADVIPRITSRKPMYDLTPLLSDEELAKNMLVPYERRL